MNNTTRSSYNRGYINIKKIISDSNRIVNSSFGDDTIDQYKINIDISDINGNKEKEERINDDLPQKKHKKEKCCYQCY